MRPAYCSLAYSCPASPWGQMALLGHSRVSHTVDHKQSPPRKIEPRRKDPKSGFLPRVT